MFKKSILTLLVGSALTTSVALQAQDINFSGFASIYAGTTLDDDERLYGYDENIDLKPESLFAIQAQSQLSDNLSVTAQLLARGSDDYDVGFEWAYLSYELNQDTKINAGRLRTPLFQYSDYMDVGYAYTWARVPQSVYSFGFENMDGVSLYRTANVWGLDSTLQVTAGSYDGENSVSGNTADVTVDNMYGASWELEKNGFSGRITYFTGDTTFSEQNLDGAIAQFGADIPALQSQLDVVEDKGVFKGVSFSMDKWNVLVDSEYTTSYVDNSILGDYDTYYVSVGYRIEEFTPFVSFESAERTPRTEIVDQYSGTPVENPLNGLVNSVVVDNETVNAGLRYDFASSAAFKVQYSDQTNNLTNEDDRVISVGLDLIF